jgi:hypothetical protein
LGQDNYFSYKEFLQSQSEYIDYLEGKNKDTLRVLNLITKNCTIATSGYHELAKYYVYKDPKLALKYLQKAFQITYFPINETYFGPIINEISSISKIANEKYKARINWELDRELNKMYIEDQRFRSDPEFFKEINLRNKQDSIDKINQNKLRNIISKYGWPNYEFVTYKVVNDLPIIIVHSPQKDNLYILATLIKQAQKGKISWFSPEAIMFNLMWRFPEQGYFPFRLLNPKKNFKDDVSFFELNTLKKVAESNESGKYTFIHLYSPQKENLKSLKLLKYRLIEIGILESKIIIHDKAVLNVKSAVLRNNNFIFKIQN